MKKQTIIQNYRHGDDTAAARWLLRYRRLRFRPQCLRYFRTSDRAYPQHTHTIITAYRAIQRRRRR